jgi:hypothetical protein
MDKSVIPLMLSCCSRSYVIFVIRIIIMTTATACSITITLNIKVAVTE